jgi:hypothetical protein
MRSDTLHRESKPAKQASPGLDALSCSLDAEYPAVKGLPGAVEARINALLRPNGPLLESDCDVATSYEIRYQIALNEVGYLSVVFDGDWCCGAHPEFSKRFVNLRIRDGQVLTLAELFRPRAAQALSLRLLPFARQALVDDNPMPPDEWLAELTRDPSDFSLERGGLRFSLFNAAPHVVKAAFNDGFFLSCQELETLARHPGPLDALCASARP